MARTWRTAAAVLAVVAALLVAGRLAGRGLPHTTPASPPPAPARPAAVTGALALPGEGIVQLVAGQGGTLWALGHSRVFRIDTQSGRVAARIPLPGRGEVGTLTVAENGVWVLRDGAVLRIDPVGDRVTAMFPAGGYTGLTVGPAAVWLWGPGLGRVDLRTGRLARLPTPSEGPVALDGAALWTACCGATEDQPGRPQVLRVDPRSGRVLARVRLPAQPWWEYITAIVARSGSVWAGGQAGMLWRIDPRRGRLEAAIPLPGYQVSALTVDQDGIWVHNGDRGGTVERVGTVVRVDPHTNRLTPTVYADHGSVAVASGAIWAVQDADLVRTDPTTWRTVAKLRLGEANLVDVAAAAGAVWVATADEVMRIDPALVRSAAPARAVGG
jgi:hypothetical protein